MKDEEQGRLDLISFTCTRINRGKFNRRD